MLRDMVRAAFSPAIAIISVTLCGGCSYFLDASLAPDQPTPPGPPTISPLLSVTDYYVEVIADAEPAPGVSPESVCSRPFIVPWVGTKADAISVSAILDAAIGTTTAIPLFTVNSNTSSNTCDIQYSERYLLPYVLFGSNQLFTISAAYLYQTTGTQVVTNYLQEGTQLAASFVATGTPALATATSILGSSTVSQIDNTINGSLLSQETKITKKLVDLNYADPTKPVSQAIKLLISRIPTNDNRTPQTDKAMPLATLTVTVRQVLTVLGKEPAAGQQYPTYDNMQWSMPLVIFPSTTIQTTDALLNTGPNINRMDNVSNLATNASKTTVSQACRALDNAMQTLHLNTPDRTAFLWYIYSQSDYAAANENANGGQSNCLTPVEKSLVKAMVLPPISG